MIGGKLIVGVTTRFFDIRRGKNNVMEATATRIRSVKNSGYADIVIKEKYKEQKIDDIKKYNISAIVFESDWKGKMDYLKEYCEVIYLPRTEGISSTILRQEKMPFDVVVPYVNPNDEKWINLYDEYKKEGSETYKDKRFRDTSFLKYVLRSIDKYIEFINNVFLVVQSESQVPKWVDRETVKVVLHEEFIPREFLPTFNCNTIETHLHLIPNLSEKFIYFNDDMLLNNINYVEDYFIGDKCVHYMIKKETNSILSTLDQIFYRKLRFSNINVLHKIFKDIGLDSTYNNSHGPTPMLKSLCEKIYKKIDIKNHISVFREYKNLTQELFTVYALYCRKLILLENSINTNISSHLTIINKEKKYLPQNHETMIVDFFSDNKKTYCMNDVFYNDEVDIDLCQEIRKIITKKFFKKSKYEK